MWFVFRWRSSSTSSIVEKEFEQASDVEDRIFQGIDFLGGNDEPTMASMFLILCTVTSNMTTYNDFFVSSSGGIVMTIVVALKPNIALLWSPIVMRCDGSSRIG